MPPVIDCPLLQRHKQFLGQAKIALQEEITDGQQPFNNFIELLLRRLEEHAKWLAGVDVNDLALSIIPRWGHISLCREPADEATSAIDMRIDGPGEEDVTLVSVSGEDLASTLSRKIQVHNKMSSALSRAVTQATVIIRMQQVLGHSATTKQATQTHIVLLKQYNDVRDVSQQLIGIIADSRGQSVRSLYEDGLFGVGADD